MNKNENGKRTKKFNKRLCITQKEVEQFTDQIEKEVFLIPMRKAINYYYKDRVNLDSFQCRADTEYLPGMRKEKGKKDKNDAKKSDRMSKKAEKERKRKARENRELDNMDDDGADDINN